MNTLYRKEMKMARVLAGVIDKMPYKSILGIAIAVGAIILKAVL